MFKNAADGVLRAPADADEPARDVATALAMSVFPQPGGPYRRSPLGARRP